MTSPALWMIIIAMGAVTYALRLSMILLFDSVAMPELIRRSLRFVPAAVLSALVVPALLAPDPVRHTSIDQPRLIAGVLAAVVAWRTKNVFVTIAVGMALLWILQSVR